MAWSRKLACSDAHTAFSAAPLQRAVVVVGGAAIDATVVVVVVAAVVVDVVVAVVAVVAAVVVVVAVELVALVVVVVVVKGVLVVEVHVLHLTGHFVDTLANLHAVGGMCVQLGSCGSPKHFTRVAVLVDVVVIDVVVVAVVVDTQWLHCTGQLFS